MVCNFPVAAHNNDRGRTFAGLETVDIGGYPSEFAAAQENGIPWSHDMIQINKQLAILPYAYTNREVPSSCSPDPD
jgi:hypothetical protein